jgi:hypothetical protein
MKTILGRIVAVFSRRAPEAERKKNKPEAVFHDGEQVVWLANTGEFDRLLRRIDALTLQAGASREDLAGLLQRAYRQALHAVDEAKRDGDAALLVVVARDIHELREEVRRRAHDLSDLVSEMLAASRSAIDSAGRRGVAVADGALFRIRASMEKAKEEVYRIGIASEEHATKLESVAAMLDAASRRMKEDDKRGEDRAVVTE